MDKVLSAASSPQIFRHLWGVEESLTSFLPKLREQQLYQGIESGLVWLDETQRELLRSFLLEGPAFSWAAMVFTDFPHRPFSHVKDHLHEFHRQVEEALSFAPAALSLINVHGGKDSWTPWQQEEYFKEVLATASSLKVPIVHETHRGRILYNPWRTRELLQKFPDLHLCADFSHWVTVCERTFQEEEERKVILECARSCRHIHARVGHEEAPQVSDPRAPEWQGHREQFEAWWVEIARELRKNGRPLTVTPEYGPSPYLPQEPFSQRPLAALGEIVDWSARRLLSILS